jgi:hypothetical protein
MSAALTEIVIDCNDVDVMARFWSAVLGWDIKEEDEDRWMSATGDESSLMLVFVPVPEAKAVKDRIHLDVSPQDGDQAEEVERILALGARRVDIGQGEVSWVVLADPEDNEFCVLRRRVG